MQKTEKLNLNKPEKGESYDVDHFNENADIIDAALGDVPERLESVEKTLSDGVGDYTAPTIASSPAVAVVPDTSSVPISSSSGILNRITWSNFKNVLKSYFDTIYPPKSHSTTATTYGVGTQTAYGHTKVVDNLTTTSAASGMALSARQGNVLKGLIDGIQDEIDSSTADNTKDAINSSPEVTTIGPEDKIVKITAANGGLEHITFSQLERILKAAMGKIKLKTQVTQTGSVSVSAGGTATPLQIQVPPGYDYYNFSIQASNTNRISWNSVYLSKTASGTDYLLSEGGPSGSGSNEPLNNRQYNLDMVSDVAESMYLSIESAASGINVQIYCRIDCYKIE